MSSGTSKLPAAMEAAALSLGGIRTTFFDSSKRYLEKDIPAKILELNGLLKDNPLLNVKDLEKEFDCTIAVPDDQLESPFPSKSSRKKRKFDDSSSDKDGKDGKDEKPLPKSRVSVSSNQMNVHLMDLLRIELMEAIDKVGVLKLWIQLNIPRIEDGNNFGVSVQEDTVGELGRAEDSFFSALEAMTKYFIRRGKLVSKVLKYPGVEDYRQSVKDLDLKQYSTLRLCYLDVRNTYALLHDLIVKNYEKISIPRTSNHMNTMY